MAAILAGEKDQAAKEKEALAKLGIVLKDEHMAGYKYTPFTKVAKKCPWEVLPAPNGPSKCTSTNWSHGDVNFEFGDGIAYITLNRPAANNALNDTLSQGLHDAAVELTSRPDVRVVVLRAEGKMFCAGGDPKSFADAQAMTDADNRKACLSFMKFLYLFQNLPQFTIGLSQGSAMGGGVGLLAACDMVIAVKAARFTVSETKLGTAPAAIAPFVAQKMGATNAKRMLCTAENLTADKCKAMGLINEVVETEADFSPMVADICEKVSLCAPKAVGKSKKLVMSVYKQPLNVQVANFTAEELAMIRIQEEAVKGMVAVQAKVKPYWAETPIKPLY